MKLPVLLACLCAAMPAAAVPFQLDLFPLSVDCDVPPGTTTAYRLQLHRQDNDMAAPMRDLRLMVCLAPGWKISAVDGMPVDGTARNMLLRLDDSPPFSSQSWHLLCRRIDPSAHSPGLSATLQYEDPALGADLTLSATR